MDRILQVEFFHQRSEIVGVGVHFVAIPRLARSSMAAAVVGNAAIPMGAQKQHLIFPGVRAQRPAMAEDHGLSTAPILVIDLRAVLRRDGVHRLPPSVVAVVGLPANLSAMLGHAVLAIKILFAHDQ